MNYEPHESDAEENNRFCSSVCERKNREKQEKLNRTVLEKKVKEERREPKAW